MRVIRIAAACALAAAAVPAAAQSGAGEISTTGAPEGLGPTGLRDLRDRLGRPLPQIDLGQRGPALLGKDGALPADEEDDTGNLLMAEFLRKRDQVIMPAGPGSSSDDIAAAANLIGKGCKNPFTLICGEANALRQAATAMAAAGRASPTCETAAAAFRTVYATLSASDAIALDYDRACLGSFAPRAGEDMAAAAAERPSILEGAEQSGGLLDAVGLLEVNGEIQCGGLLLADRTFITARHCLRGLDGVRLTVRSASRRFPAVAAAPAPLHPAWSKLGVAADWAILKLEGSGALPVPPSRLGAMAMPGEVSLVGFYRYARPDIYAAGEVPFERDLRFPKSGMCQAVEDLSGCLQLACQTVRGFSGTPVFRSRGGDGPIEVVGFLSGGEGKDTKCRMSHAVDNSSYAVSATMVGRL